MRTLCVMLFAVNLFAQCDFNTGEGCKCTQFDNSFQNTWYAWGANATKSNTYHHYNGVHAVTPNGHITLGCHYNTGVRQPDGMWSCDSYPYAVGDFTNYEWGQTAYSNYFHCTRGSNNNVINDGVQSNGYNGYIIAEGAAAMNEIPTGYDCSYWAPEITWNNIPFPPGPVVHGGTTFPTRWDDWTYVQLGCPYVETTYGSPLVIVADFVAFKDAFTSLDDGVRFGIASDDRPVQTSWTRAGAGVAFLVLPDDKGRVRSLKWGMFGNLTPQTPKVGDKLGGTYPTPYKSNGFEALLTACGGAINPQSKCWSELRLWTNLAHDGVYDPVSKPWEVQTLDDVGITAIDADYEETHETDRYGNERRFKGKVRGVNAQIYDVFLIQ